MEIDSLVLDYYSGFLGEPEVRLYATQKNVIFRKQLINNVQLLQGENNTYYFSLWEGYFNSFFEQLMSYTNYPALPKFLRNYNECIGWAWNNEFEIVTNEEINWLLGVISNINTKVSQELPQVTESNACINDLIIFLKFVQKHHLELRISKE